MIQYTINRNTRRVRSECGLNNVSSNVEIDWTLDSASVKYGLTGIQGLENALDSCDSHRRIVLLVRLDGLPTHSTTLATLCEEFGHFDMAFLLALPISEGGSVVVVHIRVIQVI